MILALSSPGATCSSRTEPVGTANNGLNAEQGCRGISATSTWSQFIYAADVDVSSGGGGHDGVTNSDVCQRSFGDRAWVFFIGAAVPLAAMAEARVAVSVSTHTKADT